MHSVIGFLQCPAANRAPLTLLWHSNARFNSRRVAWAGEVFLGNSSLRGPCSFAPPLSVEWGFLCWGDLIKNRVNDWDHMVCRDWVLTLSHRLRVSKRIENAMSSTEACLNTFMSTQDRKEGS